jgi:hypothetical protein
MSGGMNPLCHLSQYPNKLAIKTASALLTLTRQIGSKVIGFCFGRSRFVTLDHSRVSRIQPKIRSRSPTIKKDFVRLVITCGQVAPIVVLPKASSIAGCPRALVSIDFTVPSMATARPSHCAECKYTSLIDI